MTSLRSDITIRRARAEDLDQLMEIGDVYSGRDYFQVCYAQFLTDPDIHPLVAEVDGKAVGFYMNHLLDGGQTVIKRCGRVHSSYRGQGIFLMLSDHLDLQCVREWPAVKFQTFCTNSINDKSRQEFLNKGFVQVVKKRTINLLYNQQALRAHDDPNTFADVREMTYDDVRLLFSHTDVTRQLFPQNRLLNWFIGYRLLDTNIRFLVGDNKRVFATTSNTPTLHPPPSSSSSSSSSSSASAQPTAQDQPSNNFSPQMIEGIDIISFSHLHTCKLGRFYELDLYTRGCQFDHDHLTAHFQRHVHELSRCRTGGGFLVTFHPEVSEERVLDVLSQHGLSEPIPGTETYKVLYEKSV